MIKLRVSCSLVMAIFTHPLYASDNFVKLDEAIDSQIGTEIKSIAPVFDFDGDGCLPSAGISQQGQQNSGIYPSFGEALGEDCRLNHFLDYSNTLHRYVCKREDSVTYCAHFFALYFKKDQIVNYVGAGHRHDWEYAAVWTKNDKVTHGSYSAHGKLITRVISEIPTTDGHIMVVYHKDGALTHAMRFAKTGEIAENPYARFVTPTIVSWQEIHGDAAHDNTTMRHLLNTFNYDHAVIPMRDDNFIVNVNQFKPDDYPTFQ
ncbi:NPP1 family protein [Thiotrichales bacterium 19S3-7]|nr:NPP1 family protein [Thiotrichales bacterium 19S3-7]MCF6800592.1 NPP1 family protein [Thiotrichales bacterium 19S3-11]